MSEIVKFNPQSVRNEVVKQMEQTQLAKFVSLPEDYKEGVFFALEKISNLTDIEKVPVTGITKSLLDMFSNKLDYRKNHCYFFVQNDKNSPTGKGLRYGWQYQGKIHVAKETCGVIEVTPVLVHEDDEFERHYEQGALIIDKHIPTFEGKIRGGYVVVEFEGGRFLVKYYTKAELDMRRDKSKAPKGNFWQWEREMYEKTLYNAVLTRIIETSGNAPDSFYDEAPPAEEKRTIEDVEIIQQDEPTETVKPMDMVEPKKAKVADVKKEVKKIKI